MTQLILTVDSDFVDLALDEIKRKAAAREIDKSQEIAALQEVLARKIATASEERDIQQQIANLTGQNFSDAPEWQRWHNKNKDWVPPGRKN